MEKTTPPSTATSTTPLVLAWIDSHPRPIMLLYAARKQAQKMGAKWGIVYVETPNHFLVVENSAPKHMVYLCTLAEQMGGHVFHLRADKAENGLRALLDAEKDRISLLLVGTVEYKNLWLRWRSSHRHLIKQARKEVRVETVSLSNIAPPHWGHLGKRAFLWLWNINPIHFFYALLSVFIAYLASLLLESLLPPALFQINVQNVSLLFLASCAFSASRFGVLPGLVAAIAGSFTYSYYYMPPYDALPINNVTTVLNIAIFMLVAMLIALFTSRARRYANNAIQRERSTQALFTLYRIASTAFSRKEVLELLQAKLSDMLNMQVAFFLPPAVHPEHIEPAVPKDVVLEAPDRNALEACWSEVKVTGVASPFHKKSSWRFEPMVVPGGRIGVLAVKPKKGHIFDMWCWPLVHHIADQTAVLIEHVELEDSMQATRISEEREKLRSMLLSSVSHDLKTPLAGIIGSISVHQSVGDKLDEARKKGLLDSALEEAQRLDGFITNILDMTRLESGKIDFKPDWVNIAGVVQRVVKRTSHKLSNHVVLVHPMNNHIEAYVDAVMIEQTLQNLLDNAAKYTPAGTQVEIAAEAKEANGFVLTVRDHGSGVPEPMLESMFDKYTRLEKEDSQEAGTGLGLAICKAVLEAQDGSINAMNHPEGGLLFTINLPQYRLAEPPKIKE